MARLPARVQRRGRRRGSCRVDGRACAATVGFRVGAEIGEALADRGDQAGRRTASATTICARSSSRADGRRTAFQRQRHARPRGERDPRRPHGPSERRARWPRKSSVSAFTRTSIEPNLPKIADLDRPRADVSIQAPSSRSRAPPGTPSPPRRKARDGRARRRPPTGAAARGQDVAGQGQGRGGLCRSPRLDMSIDRVSEPCSKRRPTTRKATWWWPRWSTRSRRLSSVR